MIYTFYSYKGGVGRSMALVNIAVLMSKAKLNVIMVDWDLEAPGLERFFSPEIAEHVMESPGVIDMLYDYKHHVAQYKPESKKPLFPLININHYLVNLSGNKCLRLLPAGNRSQRQFVEYAKQVKTFDWEDFYENWQGELFFEWLRDQLIDIADVVLIDARTGVTEMGGVCTYQLADVILLFCAANIQNISGTLRMVESFSDTRLPQLRHGRPLHTLTVPSRVEGLSETQKLNVFRRKIVKRFTSYLPAKLKNIPELFEKLEIQYIPLYAFEEMIAVEQENIDLRSRELEDAYTNLLKAIFDIASDDPRLKERLVNKNSRSYIKSLISTASFEPEISISESLPVQYISAKVALVGEKGVGKSGLCTRIAEKKFSNTEPAHGMRFWPVALSKDAVKQIFKQTNIHAEITLWDPDGQSEHRLVSQLFLEDADVVLLVIDFSDPDPFREVPYWASMIKKTAPRALKFLVSSRCDANPATVKRSEINQILIQYELDGYQQTSAKTNQGTDTLWKRVIAGIPWSKLPRLTMPGLFPEIRKLLDKHKDTGNTIITMDEIAKHIRSRYTEDEVSLKDIEKVIDMLRSEGLVYRLDHIHRATMLLLKPELISQYATSVIRAARNHPRGIGAITEHDIFGVVNQPSGFEHLDPRDENIVLDKTVELLIRHDLCFREMGLLVFPSLINAAKPVPLEERPPPDVIYEFSGNTEAIYASLVVRLNYTDYFQRENLWNYAAEFSREGHLSGFSMRKLEVGKGELEIYFYPDVSIFDRVTFIRFVTDHLRTKGIYIQERYRSDSLYHDEKEREVDDTEKETRETWSDYSQHVKDDEDNLINILHLSDLHLGTSIIAHKYLTQLETDLTSELMINHLDYIVISGDIGRYSRPGEYEAAFEMTDGLVRRFMPDSDRVIAVPGNHDINWDLSEEAYMFVPKRKLSESVPDDRFIPAGDAGALLRDEELYKKRFEIFSKYFYQKIYGKDYPPDYANQAVLHLYHENRLLFLALNSCWNIDHYYRQRSGINTDALAKALDLLYEGDFHDWFKIAVWHHAVTGPEMMANVEFIEWLSVHGFQICMHGHIENAAEGFYKYDPRGIHIVGAGTFGAPAHDQTSGVPFQYNLLKIDPKTRSITVETRRKEKPDGAWSADARWGDKNNPKPRYIIKLR